MSILTSNTCGLIFLIAVIIITGLVFTTFYRKLLIEGKNDKKKIQWLALITAVLGTVIYFAGYLPRPFILGNWKLILQAILRTIFSVGRMFLGNDDFGYLRELHPGLANLDVQSIGSIVKGEGRWLNSIYVLGFWAVHALAIMTTSIILLSVFGEKLIFWFRHLIAFDGQYYILFGVTQKSLYFAENLTKSKENSCIIFLDTDVNENDRKRIMAIGAILVDKQAMDENGLDMNVVSCLKFRKTKVKASIFERLKYACFPNYPRHIIYAFSENDQLNFTFLEYLMKHIKSLKEDFNYPYENVKIYMQSDNLLYNDELERLRKDTEYKSDVNLDGDPQKLDASLFGEGQLAAKDLLEKNPIYKAVCLQDGFATKDFSVLILGFGGIGNNVLREIIAQGQFYREGYKLNPFRAFVVDNNADVLQTQFVMRYPEAMSEYNIKFIKEDATGAGYVKHIKGHIDSIRYIVIALGDDYLNTCVAMELSELYNKMEKPKPLIFAHIRDKNDVRLSIPKNIKQFGNFKSIFKEEILFNECNLNQAVLINLAYNTANEFENIKDNDELISKVTNKLELLTDNINIKSKEFKRLKDKFAQLPMLDKLSNIACAESINIKLACTGITDESQLGKENIKSKIASHSELLYRMEHLRWVAFHHINGWRRLDCETIELRKPHFNLNYVGKMSKDKMHKYINSKQHGCLNDWEVLGEIAASADSRVSDFQAYDKLIVECLPYIVRECIGQENQYDKIVSKSSNEDVSDKNKIELFDETVMPQKKAMVDMIVAATKEEGLITNESLKLNDDLIEVLAEAVHDAWMKEQEKKGWKYGPVRNEGRKLSPCMVIYSELPELEKEKDRVTVRAVLEGLREVYGNIL